jgi:hypothetical protein
VVGGGQLQQQAPLNVQDAAGTGNSGRGQHQQQPAGKARYSYSSSSKQREYIVEQAALVASAGRRASQGCFFFFCLLAEDGDEGEGEDGDDDCLGVRQLEGAKGSEVHHRRESGAAPGGRGSMYQRVNERNDEGERVQCSRAR